MSPRGVADPSVVLTEFTDRVHEHPSARFAIRLGDADHSGAFVTTPAKPACLG
jgi:hypothetical protein